MFKLYGDTESVELIFHLIVIKKKKKTDRVNSETFQI